jgi:hypothetical protein
MRVTNGIPLKSSLLLLVDAVNYVATLKVRTGHAPPSSPSLPQTLACTVRGFRHGFALGDSLLCCVTEFRVSD